jgi:hypothetical protein
MTNQQPSLQPLQYDLVLIFTDLEPDDGLYIRQKITDCTQSEVIFVVGEGNSTQKKIKLQTILNSLVLDQQISPSFCRTIKILEGSGSNRDMELDTKTEEIFHHRKQKTRKEVIDVILTAKGTCRSVQIVSIKPVQDLVAVLSEVRHVLTSQDQLLITGGFNFREAIKEDPSIKITLESFLNEGPFQRVLFDSYYLPEDMPRYFTGKETEAFFNASKHSGALHRTHNQEWNYFSVVDALATLHLSQSSTKIERADYIQYLKKAYSPEQLYLFAQQQMNLINKQINTFLNPNHSTTMDLFKKSMILAFKDFYVTHCNTINSITAEELHRDLNLLSQILQDPQQMLIGDLFLAFYEQNLSLQQKEEMQRHYITLDRNTGYTFCEPVNPNSTHNNGCFLITRLPKPELYILSSQSKFHREWPQCDGVGVLVVAEYEGSDHLICQIERRGNTPSLKNGVGRKYWGIKEEDEEKLSIKGSGKINQELLSEGHYGHLAVENNEEAETTRQVAAKIKEKLIMDAAKETLQNQLFLSEESYTFLGNEQGNWFHIAEGKDWCYATLIIRLTDPYILQNFAEYLEKISWLNGITRSLNVALYAQETLEQIQIKARTAYAQLDAFIDSRLLQNDVLRIRGILARIMHCQDRAHLETLFPETSKAEYTGIVELNSYYNSSLIMVKKYNKMADENSQQLKIEAQAECYSRKDSILKNEQATRCLLNASSYTAGELTQSLGMFRLPAVKKAEDNLSSHTLMQP